MSPDDTFTRRVCAVLLTEITAPGALTAEAEERTATVIEDFRAHFRETVARAGGEAEPAVGDSIRAAFGSVVAAADAALSIHQRAAAGEASGARLRVRTGIHVGDVLAHGDTVFGDPINVAARLQTLARPGTICISDAVYRDIQSHVDARFVDLGRHRLKNIKDPVRAYLLLVPSDAERAKDLSSVRSAVMLGAVVALTLAVAGWLLADRFQRRHESPLKSPTQRAESARNGEPDLGAQKMALGVMPFESLVEGSEYAWMCEALRDGLNTRLSQISALKVYSKEFLDFLVTRKGLTEAQAAMELGITKMLSGSLASAGDELRIETRVLDVATGLVEASHTTRGRAEDFLALQDDVLMDIISHLDLRISDEEMARLEAGRTTSIEALSTLLAAEGERVPPRVVPETPSGVPGPESMLPRSPPRGLLVAPALAEDAGVEEAAIRALIDAYRRALEHKETAALEALYAEFTAAQRAAQERYFENVRDLTVTLENLDVAIVGDEAVTSFTRTDDFIDSRTGRPIHVTVRLTKMLRRENGRWKLTGGE